MVMPLHQCRRPTLCCCSRCFLGLIPPYLCSRAASCWSSISAAACEAGGSAEILWVRPPGAKSRGCSAGALYGRESAIVNKDPEYAPPC
jgi:hypothetical protein